MFALILLVTASEAHIACQESLDATLTLTIGGRRVGHYSAQGKLLTPLTSVIPCGLAVVDLSSGAKSGANAAGIGTPQKNVLPSSTARPVALKLAADGHLTQEVCTPEDLLVQRILGQEIYIDIAQVLSGRKNLVVKLLHMGEVPIQQRKSIAESVVAATDASW